MRSDEEEDDRKEEYRTTRRREGEETNIKSNNPHLTGGEKQEHRTSFKSSGVAKWYAVVARSRSASKTFSDQFWNLLLWREAQVQVKIYKTHVLFGPCLGVQWKNWSFLWCERTGSDHFRKSGCGNSAAVVAGNAFPSQNVRKHGFRPTFGGINFGKCEATRRICSNQNVKTIRFAGRFLKHEVRLIQTHCILYSVPKTLLSTNMGV